MAQKPIRRERDITALRTYFRILNDLGEKVHEVPKANIYAMVGEKVYLSEKTAAKIIRRTIRDRDTVAAASQ